ncbi:hypothetical protein GCM10010330_15840 [Streptomyces tendae]|uniref:hypothetical protein n=1 Tax=Streptomyces tendae TaxID=1932 RepID=UPI0019CDD550|nr:hypothetical protein [Streptomyces tendae]GHA63870.1 hypothetical protein GCM10010330_15840 [Streptomyces tendae]
MAVEDMIKQLNELLTKTYRFVDGKTASQFAASMETGLLANRLEAAVSRLSVAGSVYREQLKRGSKLSDERRLIHNLQVMLSLRDDLKAGWTETVVELVHADTYSDFLEMADGLLTKGYKDAAAVITGTALEVHVRALCAKNSVPTAVAGRPKKADTMNADLKKADVYDGLQQKEVTTWMALRNSAAHGDYDDYDHAQVRRFIDGVEAFMKKFPA